MSVGRADRAEVLALREDAVRPGQPADELSEALVVAHRVAVLAETDPNDPLVVALRVALEVADARRADRRDLRVAGWEVHGGDSAWWARWVQRWMPYADLAALRATPGMTRSTTTSPATRPAPGSTSAAVRRERLGRGRGREGR